MLICYGISEQHLTQVLCEWRHNAEDNSDDDDDDKEDNDISFSVTAAYNKILNIRVANDSLRFCENGCFSQDYCFERSPFSAVCVIDTKFRNLASLPSPGKSYTIKGVMLDPLQRAALYSGIDGRLYRLRLSCLLKFW